MINQTDKSYESLQLFSGGGSRFGYYLGSYAAWADHDLISGVIVSTFGGKLSVLLVHIAPDLKQLQQLACSRELYHVISAVRRVAPDEANRGLKVRYMTHALKCWRLSRQLSNRQQYKQADSDERLLDELQQLVMFRIDDESQWLDELSLFASTYNDNSQVAFSTSNIAIIASRSYRTPVSDFSSSVSLNERLKLQELLFAPSHLSSSGSRITIEKMMSPAHAFADGHIHQLVEILTEWYFVPATRVSIKKRVVF